MKRLKKLRLTKQQLILAALLVVVVYVAVSTLNVIARNYQLQQQVDTLENENQILQLQNQQLEFQLTYYQTDAFIEKEARAKLGLQMPGEHVVAFPDHVPGAYEPPEPEPELKFEEEVLNNLEQWLYFLFRIEV